MRELPLLMNGSMVRAILEGRKTVTRRAIHPQPEPCDHQIIERQAGEPRPPRWTTDATGEWYCATCGNGMELWRGPEGVRGMRCPFGKVGDRLYVRETFSLEHDVEGGEPPHADGRPILHRPDDDIEGSQPLWTQPHYRATDLAPDLSCERPGCAQCRDHDMGPHWRPAIHMPKWAARIWLEVTDVRVERLQDITEDHAKAEGAPFELHTLDSVRLGAQSTHRAGFERLWDILAKPGTTWADNPWVWVVEFRRVEVH